MSIRTLVAALAACVPWIPRAEPRAAGDEPRPANLLLVVIDTLRADRLSCYGHERATTPCIDGLARRGLRFERAWCTAPWTLPSTVSLLTGLQPEVHRASQFFASISPDARLIAQQLAARGYDTAAVVGNYFVQPVFGFERGFDEYDVGCTVDRGGINSDRVSDRALQWLAQPREQPFFLYLHYFDPHYNYHEHDGFRFGGEDTDRVFSGADVHQLRAHLPDFDDADRRRLDELYDSEVAFTDHHLGRVLARLDELGIAGETFVVVTADHGESLGEHGWIGHTIQLYEESVRIPLIVAGPGIAPGGVSDAPVQLDDVAVPLLSWLDGRGDVPLDGDGSQRRAADAGADGGGARAPAGLLAPDEAFLAVETVGIDEPEEVAPLRVVELLPWKLFIDVDEAGIESYRLFKLDEPEGRRKKRPEEHAVEIRRLLDARAADLERRTRERDRARETLTKRVALVKGGDKLHLDLVSGAIELYDLRADPRERTDLAAAQPERAAMLRARLDEIMSGLRAAALRDGEPIAGEAADEHRRRIQGIGYGDK
jgi:arylsulfatase A-like enzyme